MPDGARMQQLTDTQLYGEIKAYRALAANSPKFGSVTQSSNGNGISTDRVETKLEAGGELNLVVRDGSGNASLELDSRTDLEESLNGTKWFDEGDLDPGQRGNSWVLAKQDGNDTVVAVAYTFWEDTDATNYLAGGYWVRGNANVGVKDMGTFTDAGPGSVFSYYDGQDSSWVRPVTGTATYLGSAEGAYVESNGDGGIWWGGLMLRANFAANSIGGCIGCPEAYPNRPDRGIYTYETIEDLKADYGTEEDLYVSLRGGRISKDGSFEGTLGVLELSTDTELPSSGGKWGGLFSGNRDASTHPSSLGGTIGGTAEGAGFIGVFLGEL